jgi:glycosyltransferase involved in cell wall biosynthesis
VDFDHFSRAAPSLPPSQGLIRVLIEGPVAVDFKRVDATVHAIRGLSGVEIVHMAADGSRPAEAVDYALGAVDHDATAGVYASSDLIVKLSCAPESFAMPVLEQFAAGGTAVVTGFTGHDQYIDASNAIVVDVDRPFEAATAGVRMLRDNPERLAALKLAASTTARRFDWMALHQKFAATLESAVQARTGTPQPLPIIDRYTVCQRETFALWVAVYERRLQREAAKGASRDVNRHE